jgi:hypothetical protein
VPNLQVPTATDIAPIPNPWTWFIDSMGKMPFSGDVTQAINPWTWFLNAMGSQIGLININVGRSSDPDMEKKIVSEVGSYGRQIGRISEALEVLFKNVKLDELGPDERRVVIAFMAMQDDISRLKKQRRPRA